ncbi:hypothetical protein XFHB_06140 [Xylella fastidiosa]|uniref:Uncharacterized protein n=1 Tax=Xylella fastidiosa TaxID=2371 RepID=A0ABC8ADV6_XYLFS|nr:hypothetical protein [Xylella fastidiosa]ALR06484.1 hypothetical protein XFHB_06140 [Xylella fastidiosa]
MNHSLLLGAFLSLGSFGMIFSNPSAHASDAISASGAAVSASGRAAGASAMLVVSMPLMSVGSFIEGASMTATKLSQEHGSSHKQYQANNKLKSPPPMQVKSVEIQQDGGYQVKLQDPKAPENQAELRWPARQDNPTAGFKVGELVHFQPNKNGIGWTVRSAQEETLAFMPTATAANHVFSETLK